MARGRGRKQSGGVRVSPDAPLACPVQLAVFGFTERPAAWPRRERSPVAGSLAPGCRRAGEPDRSGLERCRCEKREEKGREQVRDQVGGDRHGRFILPAAGRGTRFTSSATALQGTYFFGAADLPVLPDLPGAPFAGAAGFAAAAGLLGLPIAISKSPCDGGDSPLPGICARFMYLTNEFYCSLLSIT